MTELPCVVVNHATVIVASASSFPRSPNWPAHCLLYTNMFDLGGSTGGCPRDVPPPPQDTPIPPPQKRSHSTPRNAQIRSPETVQFLPPERRSDSLPGTLQFPPIRETLQSLLPPKSDNIQKRPKSCPDAPILSQKHPNRVANSDRFILYQKHTKAASLNGA